jgi:hypothetical protein
MEARRTQQWWPVWLLASVALHALLFWLLPESPPARAIPPRHAAQLELAWFDAAPPPAATSKPQAQPSRTVPQRSHRAAAAQEAPAAEAPALAMPAGPGRSDFPVAQAPTLVPGTGTALKLLQQLPQEEAHGSTLRNDETEVVDEAAVREYVGEVASRKLNEQLSVDLAAAAVGAGRIPGHFRRLEEALRNGAKTGAVKHTERSTGEVARDVVETMFGQPSAEDAKAVANTPMGYSVQQQTMPLPNVEDQRFREAALGMMAASEGQFRRASRPRLKTVLVLTQDPSGALADVSVLERSGDREFDESAIHLSRRVVRELPDSDEKGLGGHFWRSRWVFTWEPPQVKVKLLDVRPVQQ